MAEPPFDCAQGRLDEAQAGKLYDFNARFFTPVAARFISPDSIVPNPADPQSLNRYTAMANNPLKFTDPTGHDNWWVDREPARENWNYAYHRVEYRYPNGGRMNAVAYTRAEISVNVGRISGLRFLNLVRAITAKVAALFLWAKQVAPGQEWDHKPKIREQQARNGTESDPSSGNGALAEYIQVKEAKAEYRFDVFSNVHYGYIGMAAGFTEDELLDGAGYAQYASDNFRAKPRKADGSNTPAWVPYDHGQVPLFGNQLRHYDSPPDQAAIRVGIKLWNDYGSKGVVPSEAQITAALEAMPGLDRKPQP